MSRPRPLQFAVLLVAVFAVYRWDVGRQRAIGALEARQASLTAANESLRQVADGLTRTFRAETVTVRQQVVRWRRVVDSVWRTDTVPITKRETVLVRAAVGAIQACTDALGTCSALVRAKDALIANRDSALRVERAQRPTFWDVARNALVWTAAGYLTAKVVK